MEEKGPTLESDVVDLDEFPVPMDRREEEEEPWNNDKHFFQWKQVRNDEFPLFYLFGAILSRWRQSSIKEMKVVPRCVRCQFFTQKLSNPSETYLTEGHVISSTDVKCK